MDYMVISTYCALLVLRNCCATSSRHQPWPSADFLAMLLPFPAVWLRYQRHFRILPALMKKLGDDYNFEQLSKNPFFMKKFQREIEVRDADKDGKITCHDFDLIWQRHAEQAEGATKSI